jgi:hypothetical protein
MLGPPLMRGIMLGRLRQRRLPLDDGMLAGFTRTMARGSADPSRNGPALYSNPAGSIMSAVETHQCYSAPLGQLAVQTLAGAAQG